MRRTLVLWLLLFAVYAATIGLDAIGASEYAGAEPHHLLTAESIVADGDFDLRNQYAARAYDDFYPYRLRPEGRETEGRLHEPYGIGFAALIAPAYALGGAEGVELFLAALAALSVALAYRLALRVVPDPWATCAAAAVGLSAPLLAYGSAVSPEPAAGAALAGAALLAVRLDARPSRRDAVGCFALLGALPWLGIRFAAAGVLVGYLGARALWRFRRRTLAIGSIELALFSVAVYVGLNEALFGGPTPYAALAPGEGATGASSAGDYLERSYRLVALLLDREAGLLRWAPVLLLAFVGLWWLWRTRRDRLARAVPQLREMELAAGLCAGALGVQLLVAASLAPTMFGSWFPGRHLIAVLPLAIPLVGWGLRHAPRTGGVLSVLTLAASVWLYVDLRWGGGSLVGDRPDAPFGPLTEILPSFASGDDWPYWLAGALGAALAALVLIEARSSRWHTVRNGGR
jgi:hypothetical protein